MVAVVIWLSLTSVPPEPPLPFLTWDKANHGLAYAWLMYWFGQAFQRHWRWPIFLMALGMGLEALQWLGGVRSFDPFDMAANSLGVVIGWCLVQTFLGTVLATIDGFLGRHQGRSGEDRALGRKG